MHKAATRVFWALWSFPKSYMKAVKCEITWSFLGCRSDFLVICYSALLRPHSPIIFFSARYYLSWPSLMNNRIGLYIQIGMRKSKKVMKKMTKAQSKSLRKLFLYFHFSKVGVEECVCWGKGSEWFGNSDAKEHKLGETGGGKKKKCSGREMFLRKVRTEYQLGCLKRKWGIQAWHEESWLCRLWLCWRNLDFGTFLYGLYAQAYTLFWRKQYIWYSEINPGATCLEMVIESIDMDSFLTVRKLYQSNKPRTKQRQVLYRISLFLGKGVEH